MAVPKLKYGIGNAASTTLSSSVSNSDTSAPLTSDTNFNAKSGEGMVILDEGTSAEELAYSTTKSGSSLTIPLVNRGLEGGSAQAHDSSASVKGILTVGMWNDLIDALVDNLLDQTAGTTKSGIALTSPKVTTGINDSNNNELFKVTATGSAVNEFTVANAATGNGPTLSATGSDTDIDINLTPKGAGDVNIPTSANIQVNNADPKRGIYIPASALFPATTTGCAALAQGETTTNKINYKYLAFDASTEEYAWFHMPTPDYWDLGTITVKFHWTAASSSGDVIWGAAGLCRSDDDALDTALGTAVTVTDTLTATGDEHTTAATSAITIGGTPAKGDKLYLRVYRDADAGGDTLAADAHLTGITIKFNAGTFSDE